MRGQLTESQLSGKSQRKRKLFNKNKLNRRSTVAQMVEQKDFHRAAQGQNLHSGYYETSKIMHFSHIHITIN